MTGAGGNAWPTVIIGGAPRCGTSSLYDLLQGTAAFRRHPRKELFLLNDSSFWIQGTSPGYSEVGTKCYDLAGFKLQDRFVDASTTYLYQETAPAACARWLSLNPAWPLVIVFCLREPAERLYSNFVYFRDVLLRIPKPTTFFEYVDSLFQGTSHTGNQQIDHALEHGLYPQYCERWKVALGTDRIVLAKTEELADGSIIARIGAGIGVNLTSDSTVRKNESYQPKFRALQSFGRSVGSVVPYGPLRETLKEAFVRLVPKADRSSATHEAAEALERVRNYYRERGSDFAEYGLTWYDKQ